MMFSGIFLKKNSSIAALATLGAILLLAIAVLDLAGERGTVDAAIDQPARVGAFVRVVAKQQRGDPRHVGLEREDQEIAHEP